LGNRTAVGWEVGFYGVLNGADLDRVAPYALRHTSATPVLAETQDPKLVAARLGHDNETMALRRYGHLLPGTDKEEARVGERVRRKAQ
jgi:integrase